MRKGFINNSYILFILLVPNQALTKLDHKTQYTRAPPRQPREINCAWRPLSIYTSNAPRASRTLPSYQPKREPTQNLEGESRGWDTRHCSRAISSRRAIITVIALSDLTPSIRIRVIGMAQSAIHTHYRVYRFGV